MFGIISNLLEIEFCHRSRFPKQSNHMQDKLNLSDLAMCCHYIGSTLKCFSSENTDGKLTVNIAGEINSARN